MVGQDKSCNYWFCHPRSYIAFPDGHFQFLLKGFVMRIYNINLNVLEFAIIEDKRHKDSSLITGTGMWQQIEQPLLHIILD